MESFLLAFIPLFVAIDPIGVLPLFLGLTEGCTNTERRKLAIQAVFTALLVGILFGLLGHYIFVFVGISPADFKIAGGILLLIFSIREIFGESSKLASGTTRDSFIGIVPIGIPLIAGPAMITTLLILHDLHSHLVVTLALVTNLGFMYVLMYYSDRIVQLTGAAFGRVVAKVVAIFLAAIGIMMIRKGLEAILL